MSRVIVIEPGYALGFSWLTLHCRSPPVPLGGAEIETYPIKNELIERDTKKH